MDTMIQIGADPKSVAAVGTVILEILKNPNHADQATLCKAFDALMKGVSADYATIQDCTLTHNEGKENGKTHL